MSGKVVVNRCMSLDGFIAGPGHSMDWGDGRPLADFVAPDDFAEIAGATGAMLVGRRTWEVGDRMATEKSGSVDYPFSGPMFLLTHRPLEPPNPNVTILTGDIGEAVATALDAAGGKNLEILGADVAGQCLQRGLVDEILVYVLPVLLVPGPCQDRPGSNQQHAVGRRHHPPLPRPQALRPDSLTAPDLARRGHPGRRVAEITTRCAGARTRAR
jgi:dihydrofolate reductase